MLNYALICDCESKSIIYEYPEAKLVDNLVSIHIIFFINIKIKNKTIKDSRILFEKIINTNYRKYEERNKIKTINGFYYFILTENNILFFSIFKHKI